LHGEKPRTLTAIMLYLAEGTPLFTVADIALYAYTHCADEGGFDLAPYSSLALWFARVRAERGHLAINQLPAERPSDVRGSPPASTP